MGLQQLSFHTSRVRRGSLLVLMLCALHGLSIARPGDATSNEYRCAAFLKALRPKPQTFCLEADKSHYLRLSHGTEIFVPPHCFVLAADKESKALASNLGDIDLEITEVYHPMEHLLYNLNTNVRGADVFHSYGALRIKAYSKDQKLYFANQSGILVRLNSDVAGSNTHTLHGQHSGDEVMQWEYDWSNRLSDFDGSLYDYPAVDEPLPLFLEYGLLNPQTQSFANGKQLAYVIQLSADQCTGTVGSRPTAHHFEIAFARHMSAHVRLQLDANGLMKAAEITRVQEGCDPQRLYRMLQLVQWDVSKWDNSKPVEFDYVAPYFERLDGPIGSAVNPDWVELSQHLNVFVRGKLKKEMLKLTTLDRFEAFIKSGIVVTRMGWMTTGKYLFPPVKAAMKIDLGLALEDAKVFWVAMGDTIVAEALLEKPGQFQLPNLPVNKRGRIFAIAYDPALGPHYAIQEATTAAGTTIKLEMKAIAWESLAKVLQLYARDD